MRDKRVSRVLGCLMYCGVAVHELRQPQLAAVPQYKPFLSPPYLTHHIFIHSFNYLDKQAASIVSIYLSFTQGSFVYFIPHIYRMIYSNYLVLNILFSNYRLHKTSILNERLVIMRMNREADTQSVCLVKLIAWL